MRAVLGIDRKIKRTWLDALLDHTAQTTEQEQLRGFLDERLKDELPGRASRAKSVGIALRIWSGVPANRLPLRVRAISLLPAISGQERIWLHWGMTALAYRFFRDAVEVVGRLLMLQDDFTTAQVQQRLLKKWGDRATTKEAAQRTPWILCMAPGATGTGRESSEADETPSTGVLQPVLIAASPSGPARSQGSVRHRTALRYCVGVIILSLRTSLGRQACQ
jgi:hypothetical protein